MKIIPMQQNSEEWYEYRLGKSGGSEFKDLYITRKPLKGDIMALLEKNGVPFQKSETLEELANALTPMELAELKLKMEPKKRYYEMIAERVARPLTPNDYVDRLGGRPFNMMERGHILEPEAREAVEKKLKKKFVGGEAVWQRDDNPNIYISPDGWVENNGKVTEALEIKCPGSPEIIEAFLNDRYPKEYFPQVCKYFIVNEDLEKLYFALYTDLIPELELQIWTIKREDVEASLEEMRAYEDAVMQMIDRDAQKIIELGF